LREFPDVRRPALAYGPFTGTDAKEATVYVQLITFTLSGPTEAQYHVGCRQETHVFAELPGLLAKVWLRDPDTGTYGGLYLWQDRAAYEDYVSSDVFRAIQDDPSFAGVTSRGFDHFEDLTKATQPGLTVA
jgi:heme-degrading monooxygenase HmoA